MTTAIKTLPGEALAFGIDPPADGLIQPIKVSFQTVSVDFGSISHLLSERELRRPRRIDITGAELKRLAKSCQPPQEWYDGEDERPF